MTWMKPWMVGGGVAHEVEVARLLAFASSGGAEGIVTPGDLKVRPLSTPGGKIRVAPGAALMLNRFPGGTGQTYAGRLPAQEEVAVTATGSSGGRTDLVVARIHDPQYAGPVPPDPQDFSYARTEVIEGVPAGTESARELNLSYPAVALARIDLPNNTGTIQASHITDVREIAQPRTETALRTHRMTGGLETLTNGNAYPNGATWPPDVGSSWQKVRIPEWATGARVMLWWSGVIVPPGEVKGWLWAQIGLTRDDTKVVSSPVYYDTGSSQSQIRDTFMVAGDVVIPEDVRGSRQYFFARGNKVSGSDGDAIRLNSASVTALQVQFYETAV